MYKENPKTKDSGVICCIPQKGECPNECDDCFFQSGRSYLEPLKENLPNIPTWCEARNRVVRINDGNDSNNRRDLVTGVAGGFEHYFYNTAILDLNFNAPVVLTVNPAKMTDNNCYTVTPIPKNLMFVRVRTNSWNIDEVVSPAVDYYTKHKVPVVLTFMAYYKKTIPSKYADQYEWKKRTLNSYWVMRQKEIDRIEQLFKDDPLVYTCGYKGQHACKFCGNCLREYFATIVRMGK